MSFDKIIIADLILISWFFLACAVREAPLPAVVEPFSSQIKEEAKAIAKEGWEKEWEKTLEEARKEGRVVVLAGGANVREPISREFKNKYGITVEFRIGRAEEQVQRVFTERRNGIYSNDVYMSSPGRMVDALMPARALVPLEQALILPEVRDPRYWQGSELPWFDPEHYIFQFIAYVSQPIGINTEFVSHGEIKSYYDLLNPKWKGKISINDPTVSGSGQQWFTAMLSSGKLDIDYVRKLVEQKPVVVRDQRLQILWLARGKYPIAIATKSDEVAVFKKEGAPVTELTPKEGSYVSAGGGTVSMFDRAPHPNAARVYVNWILSKEGVTIYGKARGGEPSLRVDALTDFVDPAIIPQPGIEYFRPNPQYYLTDQIKYAEIVKELFKPLME